MHDDHEPNIRRGHETFTLAPAVDLDPEAVRPATVRAHFPGEEPPEGLRIADLGPGGEAEPQIRRGLLGVPFDDPFVAASVRCLVCAHRCVLRPSRVGICGVRQNRGGRLYVLSYGEIVLAKAEPIEKKPLYHFLPGSRAYSIAMRGCNFHCAYCQNWQVAQGHREGFVPASRYVAPDAIVEEAVAAGVRSIAYTYPEPTVFLEYALDTMVRARAAGLRNVWVTNGYLTPESIDLVAPHLDAANVDVKAAGAGVYRHACGARPEPVREAIVELRRRGVWLELTTLVVPGMNDGPDELAAIGEWIASALGVETPWHLDGFQPAHRMIDTPPTPAATLLRAAEAARGIGLHHVYVGNVGEAGTATTACADCDEPLIERSGFEVTSWRLRDGRCPRCGHALAGVGVDAPPVTV